MKKILFLVASLALVSFLWVGCDKKDKDNSTTPTLSGTKWSGFVSSMIIQLQFIGDKCMLSNQSIPSASAKASYVTNGSTVTLTIIEISDVADWGYFLNAGTQLTGIYDSTNDCIVFQTLMEGEITKVEFYRNKY
jgi:hypothetical protein